MLLRKEDRGGLGCSGVVPFVFWSVMDSVMVPLCLYLIGKCTLDKTVRVEYKSR